MNAIEDTEGMRIQPDPDKLNLYHRQQLSAMLDGELSPDEAKFMLRRLQHDTELAACWERWQVCGDMLRGRRDDILPPDFARRVARGISGGAALAAPVEEPVHAGKRPRLLRWGGGAALAASVALVAVFTTRQVPDVVQPVLPAAPGPVVATVPLASSDAMAMVDEDEAVAVAVAAASPSLPGEAAALAAVAAVAVAETPRRASERRARPVQSRAADSLQPAAMLVASAAPEPPAMTLVDGMAATAFPEPAPIEPRPWPRPILPGATGSQFSVGYGRLVPQPVPVEIAPFQPRIVAPAAQPDTTAPGQPPPVGQRPH